MKRTTDRPGSAGLPSERVLCSLSDETWVPGVEVKAASNTSCTRDEDDPMSDYSSLTDPNCLSQQSFVN